MNDRHPDLDPDPGISEFVALTALRDDTQRLGLLKSGPIGPNGPESALQRAVREEILTALEGPLNLATLQNVSRLANGACSLVTPLRVRGNGVTMGAMGSYSSYDTVELLPSMPMQSSGSENFGMTWMRELIGALREFNKPAAPIKTEPSDDAYTMTLAIRNAKDLGLLDVAERLTAELRDKLRKADKLAEPVEADPAPPENPDETAAGPAGPQVLQDQIAGSGGSLTESP